MLGRFNSAQILSKTLNLFQKRSIFFKNAQILSKTLKSTRTDTADEKHAFSDTSETILGGDWPHVPIPLTAEPCSGDVEEHGWLLFVTALPREHTLTST